MVSTRPARRTIVPARVLVLAMTGLSGCGQGSSPRPDASATGLTVRPANPTCRPPSSPTAPARLLSETGCVDPQNPRSPASGLIPYAVNSPLWSDGADKERFVALPDGLQLRRKSCAQQPQACTQIAAGGTPEDDGHLDLPVGSVLVKTFLMGGRRIETRLLVRFSESSWKGYGYEWRADQSDAELLADVSGGVKKPVPGPAGGDPVLWHFPSRAQCLQCHTTASGVSLGLTMAQLNRDFTYSPGASRNQLATWEQVGLFAEPLPRPLPPALPPPLEANTAIEARARSYLHANCANCHRPQGSFEGIDLRYGTPLVQMGLCNVPPEKGDLGVPGALRLVPGDPGKSLTALRMHRLGEGRMPQIGTSVVDVDGTRVIDDWIRTLDGCP